MRADRQSVQSLDRITQKTRSCLRSVGRWFRRKATASCCRSARFSATIAARSTRRSRTRVGSESAWLSPRGRKGRILTARRGAKRRCRSGLMTGSSEFTVGTRGPVMDASVNRLPPGTATISRQCRLNRGAGGPIRQAAGYPRPRNPALPGVSFCLRRRASPSARPSSCPVPAVRSAGCPGRRRPRTSRPWPAACSGGRAGGSR